MALKTWKHSVSTLSKMAIFLFSEDFVFNSVDIPCLKKFSRLSFALNLYSMGISYENKVKKIILFLEKYTGSREYCWFCDIERSKMLCNIISTHIYTNLSIAARQNSRAPFNYFWWFIKNKLGLSWAKLSSSWDWGFTRLYSLSRPTFHFTPL